MSEQSKKLLTALQQVQVSRPADFGTIGGKQTVAELKDLLALWNERMNLLQGAFTGFSARWMQADPNGFNDFMNDWVHLNERYQAAVTASNQDLSLAKINPLPEDAIVAQTSYDQLSKAMRQCYPPDGCPVQKGDWDDLYARYNAAAQQFGGSLVVDKPPQPTAPDIDQQALATTAPLDVVGMITGQIAPPGGPPGGTPTTGAGWLFVGVGAGIVGGLGATLGPYGFFGGAALGGLIAYEIKNKLSSFLPTSWISKL